MNRIPRYKDHLGLPQKTKIFVIEPPVLTASGQVLNSLPVFHEGGGLVRVFLSVNTHKNMKGLKPNLDVVNLLWSRCWFKTKGGRVTGFGMLKRNLIFVMAGIAQQATELDKLLVPYFAFKFRRSPRVNRQTCRMKKLCRRGRTRSRTSCGQ